VSRLALPERLRLRYAKLGRVRFTSQRDLARVMERAMRRAALPLAHSSGFSPRPLVSFGLALPTGCASRAEYLDLRLDATRASDAVQVARERKGKVATDDIRPAVLALSVLDRPRREIDGLGEVAALAASLSTHPRGVRPAELCGALGEDVLLLGACRTHQWIENDDRTERAEPLTEDGAVCGGLPARIEVQGG